MDYIKAFLVGGTICGIGQIFIDRTSLTAAKLLTGYVCTGVLLSLLGIYGKLVEFAGAGATVPLTGFGYSLFEGVKKAISENGIIGLALLIVIFIYNITVSFRLLKKSDDKKVVAICLYIQGYFLGLGLIGNPLYDVYPLIIYMICTGIIQKINYEIRSIIKYK